MTSSQRLETVKRVEDSREREAARRLGAAQQQLATEQERLKELMSYQVEYQENFNQRATQGVNASHFLEFHAFMEKLNQAIEQQRRIIQQCEQERQRQQLLWQERYTKSQALDKAIDHVLKIEQRARDRVEQKNLDEFGQQLHQRLQGTEHHD